MNNMGVSQSKRLVVIGNGADLYCGLPSSFANFIERTFKFYAVNQAPSLEVIDQFNQQTFEKIDLSTPINQIRQVQDLVSEEFSYENLWLGWLLFLRVAGNKPIDWADIESNMAVILSNNYVERVLREDYDVFDEKLRGIQPSVYYFLILLKDLIFAGSPLPLLHKSLSSFEEMFGNYLVSVVTSNNYTTKVADLFDLLSPNQPFNLLNFNYIKTSAILNAYERFQINAERNVHGLTESYPIIGVDSTKIPPDSAEISFTKTYRMLNNPILVQKDKTNMLSSNILDTEIDQIIFFGHSLSSNDYAYFQAIFDFYNIYSSNTILTFVYTVYDENKRNEIETSIHTRMTKLLAHYGETMDNKDHGDNLMHKLLLERRLFIRKI